MSTKNDQITDKGDKTSENKASKSGAKTKGAQTPGETTEGETKRPKRSYFKKVKIHKYYPTEVKNLLTRKSEDEQDFVYPEPGRKSITMQQLFDEGVKLSQEQEEEQQETEKLGENYFFGVIIFLTVSIANNF